MATHVLVCWNCSDPSSPDSSNDTLSSPGTPKPTKNVLVYWDRGDLDRGDEAEMIEMGIDSYYR
jgi:hypothetical protein